MVPENALILQAKPIEWKSRVNKLFNLSLHLAIIS